jgi:signal transduction histidine kinase
VHDLSLYLLELLENSVRAGATHVEITMHLDRTEDVLRLIVDDDGRGLDAAPESVVDPFYTTKADKNTGLGLSFLQAEAQMANGELIIGPSPSLGGTRVEAYMELEHLDRVPLGEVGKTMKVTAATNPEVEFVVSLTGDCFNPQLLRGSAGAASARFAQTPDVH